MGKSRFLPENWFLKWANPGPFLFVFVLFKHKFYRKTACFSRIRTRIVRVEGEHADHLTTTTALKIVFTLITGSTPRTYIVKSVKFPSIPRWKIWMGKVLYSTSPPELVTVVCYIQSLSFPLKLWSTKKVSFNEV